MARQLRSAAKTASEPTNLPTATTSSATPRSGSGSGSKRKTPASPPSPPPRAPKNSKKKITLGTSPFSSHPFPTPSQCQQVYDLLTAAHGPAVRPKTITASTRHAGCGEVPSVLDSLLRTVLSANTSASNSTRAFQGLIKRYGHDPVHGGVNWNAVRKSDVKELFKAIEKGGLANVKSKAIKQILEEVYEDTKRRNGGKVGKAEEMSLDYLHEKGDDEVMATLTGFKGVGVKTATCVLMFCLKRSAFPVDTHVFRISKLLGWVPTPGYQRELMSRESKIAPLELTDEDNEHDDTSVKGDDQADGDEEIFDRVDSSEMINPGAGGSDRKGSKRPVRGSGDGGLGSGRSREVKVTRDTTFLHLDARVPDELKYGLHQLMIRHGRYCPTCNASGGRKYGIAQNGKAVVATKKKVTVKEEKEDGTFEESTVEVVVKEEPADSDDEMQDPAAADADAGDNDAKIKIEDNDQEASELKRKPYVPIDAAGGTGERTGGNPDGSCILGELVSWERLV